MHVETKRRARETERERDRDWRFLGSAREECRETTGTRCHRSMKKERDRKRMNIKGKERNECCI